MEQLISSIRLFLRPMSLLLCFLLAFSAYSQQKDEGPRIVLIRHGEKPKEGDGLNCKGLNRAHALPAVLYAKIGAPGMVYVPVSDGGKHSRMIQTITPFVEKYHLRLNSDYKTGDIKGVAKNISKKNGTVLVVWEHNGLEDIARQLGVEGKLRWDDDDFDSMWIITYSKKGKARLQVDHEGLHPSAKCN
ncbi:MAG TPA: histidine phosphatase family protein [Puia sp.]